MTDETGDNAGIDDTGELQPVSTVEDDGVQTAPQPTKHLASLSWVLVQGVVAVVVLVLIAAEPWAFTALEEIVGIGLVAFGAFELLSVFRGRRDRDSDTFQKRWGHYLQPLAVIAAGAVLVVWPQESLEAAGYVLAVVFIVRGLLDVWAGARRWHDAGANTWVFVRGLTAVAFGVLVALFPSESVAFVVVGGAILIIIRAILATWFSIVHKDAVDTVSPADTYGVVTFWLSRHEMDAAAAEDVEHRVFLHKPNAKERLWRFAILMGLATAIATFGIATDSTAVVIGAMLVAPLMTPILGTAAGLINGKTRATAKSALITVLGATGAIALAWALGALIPDLEAVIQNGQVTSRTSPSLLDLAIAIAAGAAGAYGVSRAESTDALPGVAVAIALVPPLAVVGLTLHAGDFTEAGGALLLFLTNLFSIILMAGIVFILVGYGSWGRLYHRRNRIRVSFAAVALAVVLISIPLALTAQRIIKKSTELRTATSVVVDWLGEDTPLRIEAIDLEGDVVTVELTGPETPPSTIVLAKSVSVEIGRRMTTTVRWVEEVETTARPRP